MVTIISRERLVGLSQRCIEQSYDDDGVVMRRWLLISWNYLCCVGLALNLSV